MSVHTQTHLSPQVQTAGQDPGIAPLGPISNGNSSQRVPFLETAPAEEAKKGWEADLGDFLRAEFMRTGQSRKTPGGWIDKRGYSEPELAGGA